MSTPRPRRSRLALALAATFGLVVALLQGVAGPAAATPPSPTPPVPTSMTVEAYSDPAVIDRLGDAPLGAIPKVLAAVGDDFTVTVSLWADTGNTDEAAFEDEQAVILTATGPGALPSSEGRVIAAGESSATFVVDYSKAATGVTVTAVAGPTGAVVSGTSNAFDINKFLTFVPGSDSSLGNGTAGADGAACAVVDKDNPMCGIVVLPNGASSDVALTLGPCPSGEACKNGGFVTQVIADLTAGGADIYDRTHPARLELICDKSMCGKAGVPSFTALWSQSAFGTLMPVPACVEKGVINATGPAYCTDYMQSNRQGAGDLRLVVLFVDDVRGSI